MEMRKKVQRIRIVEIERSWTTLHKMLIGMILITFLTVLCPWMVLRWICGAVLLVILVFSLRKLHELRHHGMTVIIERPDEFVPETATQEAPAGETAETPVQAKMASEAQKTNWFEQPYPDPDEELFPEQQNSNEQQ